MVPRENKSNAYEKLWGANKEYYGIFESGLYSRKEILGRAEYTSYINRTLVSL